MLEDKELRSDVKRILFYLENDDKTGKPGLVKQVSAFSERQDTADKRFVDFLAEYRQAQAIRKRDVKWLAVAWSAVTTGLFFLLKALASIFLK